MTAATHYEATSADAGTVDGSRALIVTWNPDKGQWRQVTYDDAIDQTARGEVVEEDWSTGNTTREIARGDRVFMLQQGNRGRGIIASGTVLDKVRPIPHWDQENHPGEEANTVDIAWERVFRVEDGIPTDELKQRLPARHNWQFPRSGVFIRDELADQLQHMWSNHLAGIDQNTAGSTARGKNAVADVTEVVGDPVPVAAMKTERTEVERWMSTAVIQREARLARRFQIYLEMHDRKVKRYRIVPAGLPALYSDLADVTENILYEAKGSADRMSVRLALGQVLDYGRFVQGSRLAVLLPEAPTADLNELHERHDVGCVVETTPNKFVDKTTHKRCP
jgi:hypothetical protein